MPVHKSVSDSEDDGDFTAPSGSDVERAGVCRRRAWPNLLIVGLAVAVICLVALEVHPSPRSARVLDDAALTGGVENPWRTCSGAGRPGGPAPDLHLHFLYMAGRGLPHLDIWRRFFEGAPRGSFHIWVHCQSAEACTEALDAQGFANLVVVPTVYNQWCEDLVSPMVQLLRYAINATGDAPAKFIFVGDANLPAKPFRVIREELAKHPGASDFCVLPTSGWPSARNNTVHMVKTSQWSVLSLQDAQVLLRKLPSPSPDRAMDYPLVGNTTCSEFGGCWCPDELFVFGNIFGLFGAAAEATAYPGVGELMLSSAAEQGCCRTWVMLGASMVGYDALQHEKDVSQMGMLLAEMERDLSSVVVAPMTHGVEAIYIIYALGPVALQALRNSSFLFARKFDAIATFPGYADIMFAD